MADEKVVLVEEQVGEDGASVSLFETMSQKWNEYRSGHWNFFRSVSGDKTRNQSLWKKLGHTFYVLSGDLPTEETAESGEYQRGVLDLLVLPKWLMGFYWRWWPEKEAEEGAERVLTSDLATEEDMTDARIKKAGYALSKLVVGVAMILAVPLLIIQAVLALALTIAVSPIVVLVDIFAGPGFSRNPTAMQGPREITHARQSFWLNPFTWATGAVVAFGISIWMQGVNPAVFGLAAPALGVIQGVFMGMAALLLVASAFTFVGEMIFALYKRSKIEVAENGSSPPPPVEGLKLLSYLQDRLEWMKNHKVITAVVGALTALALVAVLAFTGMFFTGVSADSFITTLFDTMSNVLMSLIQSMSHLPGLEFLAVSDAVLLPIAQILSAAFFIIAPIVMGDSVLRFFYQRECVDDEKNLLKMKEGNVLQEDVIEIAGTCSSTQHNKGDFCKRDRLEIDSGSVFSSIDPKEKLGEAYDALPSCKLPKFGRADYEHVS